MQYMYFTPRDLINFNQSGTTGKIPKGTQQLNFGQATNLGGAPQGPLMVNSNNLNGISGTNPNAT